MMSVEVPRKHNKTNVCEMCHFHVSLHTEKVINVEESSKHELIKLI